jgi:hypothetical protein
MTIDEALVLPVSVDLATAGRAFGLGRTKSYELARAGQFPCPVLTLAALGIEDIPSPSLGQQAELDPRPALDALAEVLDAIPDPITRYAAYTLLARLIELGSADRGELRTWRRSAGCSGCSPPRLPRCSATSWCTWSSSHGPGNRSERGIICGSAGAVLREQSSRAPVTRAAFLR